MALGDMAASMMKVEEVAEGRMSEIDAMVKAGKSAAEIAKELKLNVRDVKAILGEEKEDEVEKEVPKEEPKKETKEEDKEKLKAELEKKEAEIEMLKTKAETEKAKVAKKETEKLVNPETGEPLLQVGIAYKHIKDKMAKEKAAEAKLQDKKDEEEKKTKIKFNDLKRRVMSSVKEARWQIEGQLSYRGIGSYDGFHMVIDAPNEKAAEDKAYKELDKARARKKIGPGGGGSVEDADIESIERTNDKLEAPSTFGLSTAGSFFGVLSAGFSPVSGSPVVLPSLSTGTNLPISLL